MIIIGEKELETKTLSIRTRDSKTVSMTPEEFLTKITAEIANRE
jgi:threonyl-tRNA synthetase